VKKSNKMLLSILVILIIGLLLPQNLKIPVKGATASDYHADSFWYYPWGRSVTHKGVDVFAAKGTPVTASTYGLVLFAGDIPVGGKVVVLLGPKWRLHYYAHLDEINTKHFALVSSKSLLGTVGTSGNAAGKAAHLHYSMVTAIPYLWRIDSDRQGWKKMFYLNPIVYF
jgi:peptidoglycan LD-endopeptidase LytH